MVAAVVFTPGWCQTGEAGNVCVQDYQPAVGSCIANDVHASALVASQVLEGCAELDPTSALVELDAWIESMSSSRYDIGIFLAVDGGDARIGDGCLHDYLAPVSPEPGTWNPDNGPWLDLDSDGCGDFQALGTGLHATKRLDSGGGIRIACTDLDGDGLVDLSVCVSWDTSTLTACNSVQGAYPLTGSRCSCVRLPVQGLFRGPAPGSVLGLTASRGAGTLSLAWAGPCSPGDTDYAVYEGVLGDFTSHVPVSCSTGGVNAASVPLPDGDRYYLVVPLSGDYEGSYGKSGAGVERSPSGEACAPQNGFAPCAM